MSVEIRVSDDIDAAVKKIEGGAAHLIAQFAMRTRDVAKDNLHVGRGVDTGAMQESISAVTSEGSDFDEHVANAAEMNPKATFDSEPEVRGPLEAFTVVPVGYAAVNEFGGANHAAIPFLTPALETVAAHADDIAREVFDLEGLHRS